MRMIVLTSSLVPHLPQRVRLSPVPIGNLTPQFPTGQGQVRRRKKVLTHFACFPHSTCVQRHAGEELQLAGMNLVAGVMAMTVRTPQ